MNDHKYGNALVFYGGGLCDCAAFYISQFAQQLAKRNLFEKTFVGFGSFECLTLENQIKEWNDEMYKNTSNVMGGYFGTARKIDLASDIILKEKAIARCKEKNIKWIFLAGGDGSSRQMSEICSDFHREGITFVFTMPLTIDGIEGGKSFGIKAAVKASLWMINFVSSTGLRTLEGNKYPGVVFELQGRNRDDILASVLFELSNENKIADFKTEDVRIIAIPANEKWSEKRLKTRLHIDDAPYRGKILGKPTIILLSEGASIKKKQIIELAKEEGMKLRGSTIGHFSQVNGFTDDEERATITKIIKKSIELIVEGVKTGEPPFTIFFENFDDDGWVGDAHYFAKLNPREGQIATLEPKLQHVLELYLP